MQEENLNSFLLLETFLIILKTGYVLLARKTKRLPVMTEAASIS